MQTFTASFFLLAVLLHFSQCAEIGLAVLRTTQPVVAEDDHLKIFRDGFLLDDEETTRKDKLSKDDKNTDKSNAYEDFVPMLDPEADSGISNHQKLCYTIYCIGLCQL